MNNDFAKEGKYYRDSLDVRLTAEKVSGVSVDEFFAKYVSAAEPLPYKDVLSRAGLELHAHEAVHATLGFSAERDSGGQWTVTSVDADTSAAKAGLRSGDEIVLWNNSEVPRRLARWLNQQKPGELLRLRIRRGEKDENIELHLGELREKLYQIAESAEASDRARRIREGLLRGTTDPVTAHNR